MHSITDLDNGDKENILIEGYLHYDNLIVFVDKADTDITMPDDPQLTNVVLVSNPIDNALEHSDTT